MSGEALFFWIVALISVASSLTMITTRNPVRSALFLVVAFLCVAVFYVMLSAQFIAAVQIIVYAGAIMVLFLFVIMLLNLGAPDALREPGGLQKPIAIGLGIAFLGILIGSSSLLTLPPSNVPIRATAALGTVETIGTHLFDTQQPWLFPFEVTSILLLIAVIGGIVMAKRKI